MLTQDSPVSLSLQEYAQRIVDSTLLSVEEVTEYVHRLPDRHAKDAVEVLANALIQAKKLTRFQDGRVRANQVKGLVLGNYLVLDEIGRGASGTVFRARHRHMTRIVALKMIPPAMLQNPTVAKRFEREVEVMSRVSHPNFVTAYDAGEDKGAYFLILEFVDGYDLSKPIQGGKSVPLDLAIEYTLQAARGLAHAHQMGIIHRDIKPANLLLGKDGVVKILDMGLARLEEEAGAGITQSGSVMGTVDYMPPEQTIDAKTVDHRADIYSLGCTMYHLATGHPVFDADNLIGKLIAHREQPLPKLGDACEDVPPELEAIFQKMAAKNPKDRYQSMQEVVSDLEALYHPTPAETDVPPKKAPPKKVPPRNVSPEMVDPVILEESDDAEAPLPGKSIWSFFDTPLGFAITMLVALATTLAVMTWFLFGS